jgi:hypothetical protein
MSQVYPSVDWKKYLVDGTLLMTNLTAAPPLAIQNETITIAAATNNSSGALSVGSQQIGGRKTFVDGTTHTGAYPQVTAIMPAVLSNSGLDITTNIGVMANGTTFVDSEGDVIVNAPVLASATTASTTAATGAIVCSGGIGVAKDINATGSISTDGSLQMVYRPSAVSNGLSLDSSQNLRVASPRWNVLSPLSGYPTANMTLSQFMDIGAVTYPMWTFNSSETSYIACGFVLPLDCAAITTMQFKVRWSFGHNSENSEIVSWELDYVTCPDTGEIISPTSQYTQSSWDYAGFPGGADNGLIISYFPQFAYSYQPHTSIYVKLARKSSGGITDNYGYGAGLVSFNLYYQVDKVGGDAAIAV